MSYVWLSSNVREYEHLHPFYVILYSTQVFYTYGFAVLSQLRLHQLWAFVNVFLRSIYDVCVRHMVLERPEAVNLLTYSHFDRSPLKVYHPRGDVILRWYSRWNCWQGSCSQIRRLSTVSAMWYLSKTGYCIKLSSICPEILTGEAYVVRFRVDIWYTS